MLFPERIARYICTPSRPAMLAPLKSWQVVTRMASEVQWWKQTRLPPCSLEQTLLETFFCHIRRWMALSLPFCEEAQSNPGTDTTRRDLETRGRDRQTGRKRECSPINCSSFSPRLSPEPLSSGLPKILTHENYKRSSNDGCCFKPLSFKVIRYAAAVTGTHCDNDHKETRKALLGIMISRPFVKQFCLA